MKKIAVISDIHGNLHALEAVLRDIELKKPDEIWCLGDIVGYGAFPSECLELVKSHCSVILAGNHDLASCGALNLEDFNYEAREAIEWTAERLLPEEVEFLKRLSPMAEVEVDGSKFILAHGSPLNPVWEYVLTPYELLKCFYFLEENSQNVCLIGHSHIQFYADYAENPPQIKKPDEKIDIGPDQKYVLNPGSVGQPRDYDSRAAYLLISFESENVYASFYRVEYDIEAAAMAIIEEGLPIFLAQRLRAGY